MTFLYFICGSAIVDAAARGRPFPSLTPLKVLKERYVYPQLT